MDMGAGEYDGIPEVDGDISLVYLCHVGPLEPNFAKKHPLGLHFHYRTLFKLICEGQLTKAVSQTKQTTCPCWSRALLLFRGSRERCLDRRESSWKWLDFHMLRACWRCRKDQFFMLL